MATLYKYRRFNAETVDSILSDNLWLSSPLKFNDPLDTQPLVEVDVSVDELSDIFSKLLTKRLQSEIRAAQLKHGMRRYVPRHLDGRAVDQAVYRAKQDIEYNSTDPEYSADGKKILLRAAIQREITLSYGRGICSFSERPDCPLMWSHYGDQHYGICFGYAVDGGTSDTLKKVEYGTSRTIPTRLIAEMLRGNPAAALQVEDIIYCRKASEWQYEREWRLIGDQGRQSTPFELSHVIFGLRCPDAVRYAMFKILEDRPCNFKVTPDGLQFLEVSTVGNGFELKTIAAEMEPLSTYYPFRVRDIDESFDYIPEQ